MLEVTRVLAGFESSWDWKAGVDANTAHPELPETLEAGAWQVSADSMVYGHLVLTKAGALTPEIFQVAMKVDHVLAMEYIARLLRRTVDHNGPVKRHEIDDWLRKDAVAEFQDLLKA